MRRRPHFSVRNVQPVFPNQLRNDEHAKTKVMEFRSALEQWDGPTNSARFLRETFGDTQTLETALTARVEAPT